MVDWTVTITLTLTLIKKKGKFFESNLCLNRMLKLTMTCEASVGVPVKTVAVFSRTIFSCAGDRIVQNISSYV